MEIWLLVAMYLQANLMRSACFTLLNQDDNWKERREEDMKIRVNNFEEVTERVVNKLQRLEDNKWIMKKMVPTLDVMNMVYIFGHDNGFRRERGRDLVKELSKLEQSFFPNLTKFADSFITMQSRFNNHDTSDIFIKFLLDFVKYSLKKTETVMADNNWLPKFENDIARHQFNISVISKFNQLKVVFTSLIDQADLLHDNDLKKIKNSLEFVENFIKNNDLMLNMENEIVAKKFNNSIRSKFNQLKDVFIEFIEMPDMNHKEVFYKTCNTTNGMANVLRELHIDIVNRDDDNNTFNQLLDGGVSLERNFENYSY